MYNIIINEDLFLFVISTLIKKNECMSCENRKFNNEKQENEAAFSQRLKAISLNGG